MPMREAAGRGEARSSSLRRLLRRGRRDQAPTEGSGQAQGGSAERAALMRRLLRGGNRDLILSLGVNGDNDARRALGWEPRQRVVVADQPEVREPNPRRVQTLEALMRRSRRGGELVNSLANDGDVDARQALANK